MKLYPIPTGYLFVDQYDKGQLETLSIGDYGKHHNVKADFLGYSNPIHGVPNTSCMPLSEKWVVTLSSSNGSVRLVVMELRSSLVRNLHLRFIIGVGKVHVRRCRFNSPDYSHSSRRQS